MISTSMSGRVSENARAISCHAGRSLGGTRIATRRADPSASSTAPGWPHPADTIDVSAIATRAIRIPRIDASSDDQHVMVA
jgi:hypothetical protein